MILQPIKASTNLDILTKALKVDSGPWRSSFAVVREAGTGTAFMVRGEDARTLGRVGTKVTLKSEPDYFAREGQPQVRELSCEVVRAGRSPSPWLAAVTSVAAMLGGTVATLTGLQLAVSSGDFFHTVFAGAACAVSGVIGVGYYAKSCMRHGGEDVNSAFVKAVRAEGENVRIESIRVDGVERELGLRWPTAVTAKAEVKVPALPPPENYDAAFLISTPVREKVAR